MSPDVSAPTTYLIASLHNQFFWLSYSLTIDGCGHPLLQGEHPTAEKFLNRVLF